MAKVWFSSDMHFGHNKIIDFCKRPFASVDEMNHALIANWNSQVGADDIGWILGDLAIEGSWAVGLECAKQMNGRLRLVEGNHDRVWAGKSDSHKFQKAYLEVFESTSQFNRAKINGLKVSLSHFPFAGDDTDDRFHHWRLPAVPGALPLLHGHIHEEWTARPATDTVPVQINVGVDRWKYFPVESNVIYSLLVSDKLDHEV